MVRRAGAACARNLGVMMRRTILALALILPGAADAQEEELFRQAHRLYRMQRVVRLCELRPPDWIRAVEVHIADITRMAIQATHEPPAVGETYVTGFREGVETAAEDEFRRYGRAVCDRLRAGDELPIYDMIARGIAPQRQQRR